MKRLTRRSIVSGISVFLAFVVAVLVPGSARPTEAVQGGIIEKFGSSQIFSFTGFADQPAVASLMQEAGVRWTKEGMGWSLVEPTQGQFSFVNQDRYINSAANAGMNIMVELGGTPQFYANNAPPGTPDYFNYPTTSPEGRAAWSVYVSTVVNRYKDRVKAWQIFPNLDDYPYWKPYSISNPGIDVYYELLKRAYVEIKRADPTAVVVLAGMDPRLVNMLIDLGGEPYFDAIAVHNFAPPFAPEAGSLTALRLSALYDVAIRRANGKPLWVSEFGWPSAPGASVGITRELHAAYLVRSHLLQANFPTVERMFWQDWKDRVSGASYDPNVVNDNWGMLMLVDGLTKKPAFDAFKALTTELAGGSFVSQTLGTTSSETIENFETGRGYDIFFGGGATGSFAVSSTTAHSGTKSGQISYTMTTVPNSAVLLAPKPSWALPVDGQPKRVRVWARGDGGPAINLSIGFKDANDEVFNIYLGLVTGTEWKEYVGFLDPAPGTSVLLGGNQDNVIQYPIRYTGFGANIWTVASPPGSGTVWIDDVTFDSGPTVFNQLYSTPGGPVRAIWALNGTVPVSLPTSQSSVSVRNWRNQVTNVPAAGGVATVNADGFPILVRTGSETAPTCPSTRPAVRLTPTMSNGVLSVRITPGFGSIQKIEFDESTNAIVTVGGQRYTSTPFATSFPAGTTATTLTIERVTAGQAVHVNYRVFDGCGEWKTFSGAGAGR